MVDLPAIYRKFPAQEDCIRHLEGLLWQDKPECPYCHSTRQSAMRKECRYHCNNCNKSYSVTVNTIFHKSKIDLQKWFFAFLLITQTNEDVSTRQLAAAIRVTRNSAWFMLRRIRKAVEEGFNI